MNWADHFVLAVLGLSMLVGLWRGLLNEVLALAIWCVAAWAAWVYGPQLTTFFQSSITLPSARLVVGYGLCFLLVLVVGALLRFMLGRLIESTGLSGTDRLLGLLFGLARGALLMAVIVFVLNFTTLTRDPWWRESRLLPQFQSLAYWLGQHLPDSVRQLDPDAFVAHLPPGFTPSSSLSAPPTPDSARFLQRN